MKSVAAASSSAGSSAASNRDTPTPPPAGDEDDGENGKIKRHDMRIGWAKEGDNSRNLIRPLFFIIISLGLQSMFKMR